jgi:hypothetical protein
MTSIKPLRFKLPTNVTYTDPGDKGYFGIKDLDELESQGVSLKDIASFASDHRNVEHGVGKLASQIFRSAGYNAFKPATTSPKPVVEVGTQGGNSYYEQLLDDLKIANQQQASNFRTEMQRMQDKFDTEQRTTLSNQARSGQQTDTRLGGAASNIRGGTAGFRRRVKTKNKFGASLGLGIAQMPPSGATRQNLNV